MPEKTYGKFKPPLSQQPYTSNRIAKNSYAELQVASNFTFLSGASHPEEYITQAAAHRYRALALTDRHSLAGIVRAYTAAKHYDLRFLVGCRLELRTEDSFCSQESPFSLSVLVYPTNISSYAGLSRLLSTGKLRTEGDDCLLSVDDFLEYQQDLACVFVPPIFLHSTTCRSNEADLAFLKACQYARDNISDLTLLSIALIRNYGHNNFRHIETVLQAARHLKLPLVATNDVYYHSPERKPLQDVLTCIREKTTLEKAGYLLLPNSERHLKPIEEMRRLFREIPEAITRTLEIAERAEGFSLDQLSYDYPHEVCVNDQTPLEYLCELTQQGAQKRYPDGIPAKIQKLLQEELGLIHELHYEKYFLTCYDIVRFAREKEILCQGRGAAANSAVCYMLGITSVDPDRIDTLFARFVSKERNEPPDIDIDFEHERREEVIQYIYQKYGRERAALTCEVVTYRQRSAIREVGKALGLSLELLDVLAKSVHRWTGCDLPGENLRELGLNPEDPLIQNLLLLTNEMLGFPRHLSQHVGGFIISERPLCEIVPIRNASMPDRTIIEWDKDDIEELGMLKIDVLALGMLTCIRKAFELHNTLYPEHSALELHNIPAEDPKVYDMICEADTIGVFQIESRAQMSMLPRLKPRCFYDLVIEVAIVRPGPIHGNMVHPFLKRRNGLEAIHYPDEQVREVLGKTLGVPLFQEQAMRLAILLAGFSPGEAEQLRRAMAAWKKNKLLIETFQERILTGMLEKGYSKQFAESCIQQLKGFSEYGFPESHAASFALLVYASAWLKYTYPAIFAAALLNSQPMGFYAPSQILSDAKQHHVPVHPIDIQYSAWDCRVERVSRHNNTEQLALRLGMRLIKGLKRSQAQLIEHAAKLFGPFESIHDLWHKAKWAGKGLARLRKHTLYRLAKADAYTSLGLNRRQALWEIRSLPDEPLPLDEFETQPQGQVALPFMSQEEQMFADYETTGFSLKGHPIGFLRERLQQRKVFEAVTLQDARRIPEQQYVAAAGIAIFRQRPGTAKGVVFITLEDETGMTNLIVQQHIFQRYHKLILAHCCLVAWGSLQRVGKVVYILVRKLESLDDELLALREVRMPIRSYSY